MNIIITLTLCLAVATLVQRAGARERAETRVDARSQRVMAERTQLQQLAKPKDHTS